MTVRGYCHRNYTKEPCIETFFDVHDCFHMTTNSRTVPTNSKIFFSLVCDYAGNVDLNKSY